MPVPPNRVADLPRPSPDFPRRYLPASLDFDDIPSLSRLFDKLSKRVIPDAQALEAWLLDWNETSSALAEERSRRYIAMTCDTRNPAIEKAYLSFLENAQPIWARAGFELNRKLVAHPDCGALPLPRYEVLLRNVRNDIDLFREENVPLETENNLLAQRYQKICGAMSVEFRGETRPLQQMAVFLQESDREVRREAWEIMAQRRLQDRDALEALYDEMLDLRGRLARNAGFDHYMDYMFRRLSRFDYTPADCRRFHDAVERHVVPAARKFLALRAQTLGLAPLRPWDLACDPRGRPPLKPFQTVEQLIAGCRDIFERLDPELGRHFDILISNGLLDLDCRVGKAPGGYQNSLDESRMPFIFMNSVGVHRDLTTLLHEGGHAFHMVESRADPLVAYRHAPIEFCEVASMGMELMGSTFLEAFYRPADAARARRNHLEEIFTILPWIATIDAFQHWIYTHPGHTRQDRADFWLGLLDRFGAGPILDESGHEDARRFGWQRQLHLFQVPFYYIEYGIAQLGALQLWKNFRNHSRETARQYRAALALGGSRPLPDLFRAAGIRFEFGPELIAPLMDDLLKEAERAAAEETPA